MSTMIWITYEELSMDLWTQIKILRQCKLEKKSSHLYLACFHKTGYVQLSINLDLLDVTEESNLLMKIASLSKIRLTLNHLPLLG